MRVDFPLAIGATGIAPTAPGIFETGFNRECGSAARMENSAASNRAQAHDFIELRFRRCSTVCTYLLWSK
jgi:hypothetical protein